MSLKNFSAAALISIGLLAVNFTANAAQTNSNNLLCDMGPTGYAAPISKCHCKPKKVVHKKHEIKTGAAAPIIINRPAPQYAGPVDNVCPAPCPAPCAPCNPCPAPCPAPCAPCEPCPAPCAPCNPCPCQ